jgi:hypothetical protein
MLNTLDERQLDDPPSTSIHLGFRAGVEIHTLDASGYELPWTNYMPAEESLTT